MKHCNACKERKPLEDFNKRRESSDGREPRCRLCIAQRRKQLRSHGGESSKPVALTEEQRKPVYMSAILRMRAQGLISKETATSMLERVK